MQIKHLRLLPVLLLSLTLWSCEGDDDDGGDNEEELITTVELTAIGGGATLTAKVEDLDGEGGKAPTGTPLNLKANTDYTMNVRFLDASKAPVEDITLEVKTEADEHLVCYTPSGAMTALDIQDKDSKGANLGLQTKFKTGATGAGTLLLSLKHKPTKTNANPCSTGETDVQVTFNVSVSN